MSKGEFYLRKIHLYLLLILILSISVVGCSSQSSIITADKLIKTFEEKGLPIINPRDNTTDKRKEELGIIKLITTDTVSIYEFPSVELADRIATDLDGKLNRIANVDEYTYRKYYSSGNVAIIVWEKSAEYGAKISDYTKTLDELYNNAIKAAE